MASKPDIHIQPPSATDTNSNSNTMQPSTTTEDERTPRQSPFDALPPALHRFAMRPLRRSSSRLQRWVQDQQKRYSGGDPTDVVPDSPDTYEPPASTSNCHPWLAYPHANLTPPKVERDDLSTIGSYVLVEDDNGENGSGVGETENAPNVRQQTIDLSSAPATPRKSRQSTISFNTPSPLRNIARGLTQNRRLSASTSAVGRDQSPTRASAIFQRPARMSTHSRASSLAASLFTQRQSRDGDTTTISSLAVSPSGWRFKRPTVMGHFGASASDSTMDELPQLPRPSTSSSVTRSSETTHTRTSLDTSTGYQQQKRADNFATLRPHTPSTFFNNPHPSLWSLPTDASHMNDPPGSTKVLASDPEKTSSVRVPLALKPASNSTKAFNSPKRKKKRKLVISGIPPGDQRRYDHVRLWCESFGELNQITRMANGDLHVDFKRVEVADTVCRLHARVHINGVGSVGLSWFTGRRP